jgi:ribosomal protein S18 acetylase RimI-like enzyme
MIRASAQKDIPAIKALMQSEDGFWSETWRSDTLERGLTSSAGLSFVWDEANQILGFVCAHDLGFRGYLSELVVAPGARSRGIGEALVRHVEQILGERGCTVLISDVWKNAVNFYRLLGWSEPDVVLLRKRLEKKHE